MFSPWSISSPKGQQLLRCGNVAPKTTRRAQLQQLDVTEGAALRACKDFLRFTSLPIDFFFPQIASFNYRGSNTSSWGGEGSLPNFFFGQFHVVADTITYGRKERNTFTRWWGSQICFYYVSIMFHFPKYKFRVVFAVSWRVGGGLSNIFVFTRIWGNESQFDHCNICQMD